MPSQTNTERRAGALTTRSRVSSRPEDARKKERIRQERIRGIRELPKHIDYTKYTRRIAAARKYGKIACSSETTNEERRILIRHLSTLAGDQNSRVRAETHESLSRIINVLRQGSIGEDAAEVIYFAAVILEGMAQRLRRDMR